MLFTQLFSAKFMQIGWRFDSVENPFSLPQPHGILVLVSVIVLKRIDITLSLNNLSSGRYTSFKSRRI